LQGILKEKWALLCFKIRGGQPFYVRINKGVFFGKRGGGGKAITGTESSPKTAMKSHSGLPRGRKRKSFKKNEIGLENRPGGKKKVFFQTLPSTTQPKREKDNAIEKLGGSPVPDRKKR